LLIGWSHSKEPIFQRGCAIISVAEAEYTASTFGGFSMMNRLRHHRLLTCLLLLSVWSTCAYADGGRDRTQVGSNISVGPGEEVGEVTCFGCSVRVRGQVSGDITTFGGTVVIEDQAQVGGDITTFGGGIRLGKDATVNGDVTVFGGRLQRDPAATVGGDVTRMGGPGWVLVIFLAPLVFLGFFLALIVWVIRRLLRRSVPVAA